MKKKQGANALVHKEAAITAAWRWTPPDKWTMARYKRYCRDSYRDASSDFPDLVGDSSMWFDMAQGILSTRKDLAEWLREKRFRGVKNLREAFAEDLASGGKGIR